MALPGRVNPRRLRRWRRAGQVPRTILYPPPVITAATATIAASPADSAQVSSTPLVAATLSTASWNASPAAPARASPEQPAAAFSQAPASPVSLEPAAAAVPFVAAKPGPSAHGELCFRDGEDVRQQRPPAHDSE